MSSHALSTRSLRPGLTRRTIAVALTVLALGLMLAGGALPWLVLFNGLTVVRGFSLDGGLLAGVMLVVVALLVVLSRDGGARTLRPLAVVLSAGVVADSLFSAWKISAYVAAPGPTGLLTVPSAGAGAYVFAAAGTVLLAAAILVPASPGRLCARILVRLLLTVVVLVAAMIHLILVPEHLGVSPLLGAGFLLAGIAQLALAGAVLFGREGARDDVVMNAIVVVNVALIGIYVYAVLVGLPFGAGHQDDAGLTLGAGEAVDLKGGVDLIVEIAAVVLAAVTLKRRSSTD